MESWRDDADPTRSVRRRDQRGATAVEYAIMVSGIAAVIILAVTALGLATNGLFEGFKTAWDTAVGG